MKALITILTVLTSLSTMASPGNSPFHAEGASAIDIGVEGQVSISISGHSAELLYNGMSVQADGKLGVPQTFTKTAKNKKVICTKYLSGADTGPMSDASFKCSVAVDLE